MKNLQKQFDLWKTYEECDLLRILRNTYDELTQNLRQQCSCPMLSMFYFVDELQVFFAWT